MSLGWFPGTMTPVQDHGGSTHLLTGSSHLTKHTAEMLAARSQSVIREDSNESQTSSVSTPLSSKLGSIEVDGAVSTPGRSPSGSVVSEGSDLLSSFSESCSECSCSRSSYDPRCVSVFVCALVVQCMWLHLDNVFYFLQTHPLGHQLQHKLENMIVSTIWVHTTSCVNDVIILPSLYHCIEMVYILCVGSCSMSPHKYHAVLL